MRNNTLKGFSLGLIAGSFLTAGTLHFTAPAKASPADPVAVDVADTYGPAMCATLDEYPTMAGIIGIGEVLMQEGLTGRQAGQALFLGVYDNCPNYLPLLKRFASTYGGANTKAVA